MNDTETALMLNGIQQLQKGQDRLIELNAEANDRLDHLDECIDDTKAALKDLETLIKSSVPDGNMKGHHDYHLKEMQKWARWSKIRESLLGKVLEVGTIGVLGWVVLTLWGGFKIVVAQ